MIIKVSLLSMMYRGIETLALCKDFMLQKVPPKLAEPELHDLLNPLKVMLNAAPS